MLLYHAKNVVYEDLAIKTGDIARRMFIKHKFKHKFNQQFEAIIIVGFF